MSQHECGMALIVAVCIPCVIEVCLAVFAAFHAMPISVSSDICIKNHSVAFRLR